MILGIIALIAGIGCAVYGYSLNNSVEAQLESLFSKGSVDPGNVYLYIGIGVAVLGLIILLVKGKKK